MEDAARNSPKSLNNWRKEPRQARSESTAQAILDATVQVILKEGHSRLTTTRVAARAGVSVGTLYQYFPHKQALMLALFQRHLERIAYTMKKACDGQP